MKKYYLTTPIYYVNAAPHIGHAYTTIVADTIRRLKRMQGYRAVLTTGTDEHGQKVARAAREAGMTPEEVTTVVANEFRRQWEELGIQIDRFMRTTDPRHKQVVQDLFERCKRNGYIYKGSYTGQYCVFCELYVTEAKPGDPCPDCGRTTETVTEENYFFKLSAFQDRLLKLYEEQPDFIEPEIRRNEVISFVRQGLKDLSISRTTLRWGIPVPGDEKHVFYVWFDALTTYMSAVAGEDLWPADLHLIGKEILRFHAVYWPAFLMAAELPLPKKIFAHGWLLFEQDKMSKSRGNIVRPNPIKEVLGVDALRYFLLREVPFGQDGNFSYDALVQRYNADLANGLGNLASRTLSMIRQYTGSKIPGTTGSGHAKIAARASETIRRAIDLFDRFQFHRGLEAIWGFIGDVDKYIVEQAPWKLAQQGTEEARHQLEVTLYTCAESLRILCVLLAPFLPNATEKIWKQLGLSNSPTETRLQDLVWGQLQAGQPIGQVEHAFPRVDLKKAVAQMRQLEEKEMARQAALLGKKPAEEKAVPERISIDEFSRIDMRVGEVLEAERVAGTDRLVKLVVHVGEPKPRTIVAGIGHVYEPSSLIGKKVVVVVNLQPRKLRGIVSDGMIVAATGPDGKPVLATFTEEVAVGARLS